MGIDSRRPPVSILRILELPPAYAPNVLQRSTRAPLPLRGESEMDLNREIHAPCPNDRRRTRMDSNPRQLSEAEPHPQRTRAGRDRRRFRGLLVVDVGCSWLRLLAEPLAVAPSCLLPRPPVHDPSRLRARLLLPPSRGQ